MRRLLSFSSVFAVLALGMSMTVLAHGGGTPQLTSEPVGPYLLSAWTNPNPATVGVVHLTAALADASTGAAVADPMVQVSAVPSSGDGAAVAAEATHDGAEIPVFYEADLHLPSPGDWRLTVAVDGAQGEGTATFTLPVRPAGPNRLLLGLAGVGVVVVAGVGWMRLRRKDGQPERGPDASRTGSGATGSDAQ